MRAVLILLLGFALSLAADLAFAAPGGRRVAFVIGNAHYAGFPALNNPRNDAEDVTEALKGAGFEVFGGVDITRESFREHLRQFTRAAQGAEAAVAFYAGHGLQYKGRNFIVPIDAKLQDEVDIEFEAIAVDDVLRGLSRADGVRVLILDACRDLPLKDKRGRAAVFDTGLAKISGRGLVVAYATQANALAYDGTGRNSVFTRAFLQTLREPGLDLPQFFQKVSIAVDQSSGGRQTPEISLSYPGQFIFNARATDRDAWQKLRDSNDPVALREFLQKYPVSDFADAANSRLALIEEMRRADQREAARRAESERRQREEESRRMALAEEERRRAEAARLAEETRAAEEARMAEALRRARLAEERQRAEAARLAEEMRRVEEVREARLTAERRTEEARQARLAEDARRTEEARQARLDDDRRRAEAARVAEEARRTQEQRIAALAPPARPADGRVGDAAARASQSAAGPARPDAEGKPAVAVLLDPPSQPGAVSGGAASGGLEVEVPNPTYAHLGTGQQAEPAGRLRLEGEALVRTIHERLSVVGCYTKRPDAAWSQESVDALRRFYHFSQAEERATMGAQRSLKIAATQPGPGVLDDLNRFDRQICPLVCPEGAEPRGGVCVTVTCPTGYRLKHGACAPLPGAERPGKAERESASPKEQVKGHARAPRTAKRPELRPEVEAPSRAAPAPSRRTREAKAPPPPVRERPVARPTVKVVDPVRLRPRVAPLARSAPLQPARPTASASPDFGPAHIGAVRAMTRMP